MDRKIGKHKNVNLKDFKDISAFPRVRVTWMSFELLESFEFGMIRVKPQNNM